MCPQIYRGYFGREWRDAERGGTPLGLKLSEIQELAKDIIFGQLRLVIATMDIEGDQYGPRQVPYRSLQ